MQKKSQTPTELEFGIFIPKLRDWNLFLSHQINDFPRNNNHLIWCSTI